MYIECNRKKYMIAILESKEALCSFFSFVFYSNSLLISYIFRLLLLERENMQDYDKEQKDKKKKKHKNR